MLIPGNRSSFVAVKSIRVFFREREQPKAEPSPGEFTRDDMIPRKLRERWDLERSDREGDKSKESE